MADWLLGNYAGSWNQLLVSPSPYTLALPFQAPAGGAITAMRWYRATTGGLAPTDLALFDNVSGLAVWQTSATEPVPDNGAVGWQEITLASPYSLIAGRTYHACGFWPAGHTTSTAAAGFPSAIPGIAWVGNSRSYHQSSSLALPTSYDSAFTHGIDAFFDVGGGSPPPPTATPADLQAALADWLSTSDNLHQSDGLPWRTDANVSLVQVAADAIKVVTDKLGASGSGNSLDWIAGLWRLAGDLTDAEIGLLKSLLDRKDQITGASGGGGSAFYGPDGTQVAAGVSALIARSTNAMVGFPAAPWTLTHETDWDDAIAYAEPADLYAVTFTSTPPGIPDNGRAGVPVRYRLAWWSPLNGTFAQERRWVDFESVHLVDPAGRMPGVLLQTYAGGAGHIQAWTLTV